MLQFISLAVILLLVAADQIIKYFVVSGLKPIGEMILIPGVLRLTYVENDGAMMGMLGGKASIMTVVTVIILIALVAVMLSKKIKFGLVYCCFVAIISGGIGNLIDRFRLGYVIDYIDVLFVKFYVFNFADCLVTVGAFLIIGYELYEIIREGKAKKEKQNG